MFLPKIEFKQQTEHIQKIPIGLLLLCLYIGNCNAQPSYSFLHLPIAARVAALGGVNVSLPNRDINLFINNPALNGDTLNRFVSANYQAYFAGITHAAFAYQHLFKKTGAITAAIQHINYGTIESYDATGTSIGRMRAAETAMIIGKKFHSGVFHFGTTGKIIFSTLAQHKSTALAIDIGALFTHPRHHFTVGLVIKNAGLTLSEYSRSSSSKLPLDVQAGTTFKPQHMPVQFSFTVFDLTNFDTFEKQENSTMNKIIRHINIGVELLLNKNINLLMGYNFRTRQDFQLEERIGGAGFSLGLSLQIKKIELVVNRSSYGPRQTVYGFTLSSNIKKIINKKQKS